MIKGRKITSGKGDTENDEKKKEKYPTVMLLPCVIYWGGFTVSNTQVPF